MNLIQYVHPEIQTLYRQLEMEFHPLKLSARVSNSLEFIGQNPDLACYIPSIQDITITRLVKQVGNKLLILIILYESKDDRLTQLSDMIVEETF